MPTSIDSLQIEINAKAQSANTAIDKLVVKLNHLNSSLSKINGSKLTQLANGVSKLGSAMQTMNGVKTGDFTRLANNLSKLNAVDTAKLSSLATTMHRITDSFSKFGRVSKAVNQLSQLSTAIRQLGYKSVGTAITNIPQLAVAMRQLMTELSKAPRVNRSIIDMTNALAKLGRTGASSGKAAQSLGRSLNLYSASTERAKKASFSLAGAIGKVYATYWLLFRAFGKLKDAIDISADLTEVENVVNVTFGQYRDLVDDMARTSIKDFGMSELTVKKVSSRFQAMGSAMEIPIDKISDMSVELTKLTADMASFYNMEQKDVAQDLESIFTGTTRPMRTYGIDLTQANLKQWALNNGMNANIETMTQAEKTMLRYQYVMAQTTHVAGDFQRTQDTWTNQIRILKQQFEQLGIVIGRTFIAMFKPMVKALNAAMSSIIAFAQRVSEALGKIFGWKYEEPTGGIVDDLGEADDEADGLASGLDDASKNAKKLRQQLQGFDELNVLTTNQDGGGAGAGAGTGGGASGGVDAGKWVQTDSIIKAFESEIDTLYKLGEYIRDALIEAMESIDWDSVYAKARGFGKGLAEYLNGLLAYDGEGRTLFGTVGKTIAKTLNTVIYAALEFAKEFDFYQFGVNLADGINEFFRNFDFASLAETLNEWVNGIEETILGFLDTIEFDTILQGFKDFFKEIELETIGFIVGSILWHKGGKELTKNVFRNLFVEKMGLKSMKFTTTVTVAVSLIFVGATIKEQLDKIFAKDSMYNIFPDKKTGTDSWGVGDYISNLFDLLKLNIKRGIEGLKVDFELWWDDFVESVTYKIFKGGLFNNSFVDMFGEVFDNIPIPLKGFWDNLKEALNAPWEEGKGIFSEEVGGNIVDGIIEGMKDAITKNIPAPIMWAFDTVYNTFCDVFGIHSPAENMKPIGSNILLGVVDGFKSKYEEFTKAITDFYNNRVKPWFSKDKWTFEGVKEGFSTAFSNAFEGVKALWNKFAEWINDKLTFNIDPLEIGGKKIFDGGEIKIGELPTFKNGGFPEDGLFMANHGELVGRFSNGKTAVANNEQIVSGIEYGVERAVSRVLAPYLANIEQNTRETANKEFGITERQISNAVVRQNKQHVTRTGKPLFA